MKFLTKIKLALAFQVSLNYDAEQEYQKIIDKLEKYRFFVESEMKNTFPEYYILLGEAYCHLTNFNIAEGYFLRGLQEIKNTTELNTDEINYLNSHIYFWLYSTYKNLYNEIKAKQCLKLYDNIKFDKKNIRKNLKNAFPMHEN